MRLTFSIDTTSTRQLLRNLYVLPRNVARKQLLIALNAAGGVGKAAALRRVGVRTGLLKKSLVVKIIRDKRAANTPAGVLVGPSRKVSGYHIGTKRIGMARALRIIAKYKAAANVPAKDLTKQQIRDLTVAANTKFSKPSRYAHLSERKHPAIAAADAALRGAGLVKLQEKIAQGIAAEAAALPK